MSTSPNLLIGCALKKEVVSLRRRLSFEGPYLVTGPGLGQTRKALRRRFQSNLPELFLFTGAGGQLAPHLELGETVFPDSWCLEDGSLFSNHRGMVAQLKEAGWTITGCGLTVRRPVVTSRARRRLFSQTGALICDMESAAALSLGQEYQIPSLALKVVTDTADSGIRQFWLDFDANMERLAEYLSRLIPCLEDLLRRR